MKKVIEVILQQHGMAWVCVWVLEPAKPCPSPPGASKASLFAPFLTNQRKLVSFFCPFRWSLQKPYFFLLQILLFQFFTSLQTLWFWWVQYFSFFPIKKIETIMTPQNPSMDQYVEPISRSTFRGWAQYKRELKSRNEWRRHHWTPQEACNKKAHGQA